MGVTAWEQLGFQLCFVTHRCCCTISRQASCAGQAWDPELITIGTGAVTHEYWLQLRTLCVSMAQLSGRHLQQMALILIFSQVPYEVFWHAGTPAIMHFGLHLSCAAGPPGRDGQSAAHAGEVMSHWQCPRMLAVPNHAGSQISCRMLKALLQQPMWRPSLDSWHASMCC